ncbi:MAG TPA: putative Fe-S cluster assembly protein SufT [Acidobacteriaceae bacterium]|nr:putative Fe-S cluster assembly protein SufT [Acidobacteriaceae bacterium]
MIITNQTVALKRDCAAIAIPAGTKHTLAAGTCVRITQAKGGSYTVSAQGALYRIEETDAVALGIASAAEEQHAPPAFSERMVWDQLKTIYDPEIPVNIVDLGLIYECAISDAPEGGKTIDVQMSLTAPGCGMSDVLKADVETKLRRLPEVKAVSVAVVFDPPWNPGRMSEAAKLQLGFDLDYGSTNPWGNSSGPFPILR